MSLYNSSEDKKRAHTLKIDARNSLEVCGVEEVLEFDEEMVRLKSSEGALDIEGSGIKIDVLDTESGVVKLTGRINALYYENGVLRKSADCSTRHAEYGDIADHARFAHALCEHPRSRDWCAV
jgi:sporulation protein YabP